MPERLPAHEPDAPYLESGDNRVTAAAWYGAKIRAFKADRNEYLRSLRKMLTLEPDILCKGISEFIGAKTVSGRLSAIICSDFQAKQARFQESNQGAEGILSGIFGLGICEGKRKHTGTCMWIHGIKRNIAGFGEKSTGRIGRHRNKHITKIKDLFHSSLPLGYEPSHFRYRHIPFISSKVCLISSSSICPSISAIKK